MLHKWNTFEINKWICILTMIRSKLKAYFSRSKRFKKPSCHVMSRWLAIRSSNRNRFQHYLKTVGLETFVMPRRFLSFSNFVKLFTLFVWITARPVCDMLGDNSIAGSSTLQIRSVVWNNFLFLIIILFVLFFPSAYDTVSPVRVQINLKCDLIDFPVRAPGTFSYQWPTRYRTRDILPGPDWPSATAAVTGDVDLCKCGVNDMDWLCTEKNTQKYQF